METGKSVCDVSRTTMTSDWALTEQVFRRANIHIETWRLTMFLASRVHTDAFVTVRAVDATAVSSATDMGQALDQSGSITYTAEAPRRSLETVITEYGAQITAIKAPRRSMETVITEYGAQMSVLILKTSPLHAIIIPVPTVWIICGL